MVTIYKQEFSNNKMVVAEFRGLSTDDKPITIDNAPVGNGSVYIEIDTGKMYMFDLQNKQWEEI